MSDCIHEEVCEMCDVEPEICGYYVPKRGKCKAERHGSLANWPEMVCWSCSECGFGWNHSINDKQFRYCPNCGRKVER